MKVTIYLALALFSILVSDADAIQFTEVARFNIDATASNAGSAIYIGSNPNAVAWTGDRLFVAGFNNTSTLNDTGIIEVLGATSLGITNSPTYSDRWQTTFTPAGRGYTALDVSADGQALAVGFDFGFSDLIGFQVFNTGDESLRWNVSGRGSSGATFDPGFGGIDSGVAFGAFGSARRTLQDLNDGTTLYDTTDGLIWYDQMGPGTFVRDLDFDPIAGDVYVRHNNQVSRAIRTGGNEAIPQGIIAAEGVADFVASQNLSFMSSVMSGDVLINAVIYNDRETTVTGQSFADSIKVVEASGLALPSPEFEFLSGIVPLDGTGWYDFDFDPESQTLAILDSANRNVHIFEVGSIGFPSGDFDGNGFYDCNDIDMLVAEVVDVAAGGMPDLLFDVTGDSQVNGDDVDAWRVEAGNALFLSGNPVLEGDANLDGVVDGLDFIAWNNSKFTTTAAWCSGDFNADGTVDGIDFIRWNDHKFMQSDVAAVPEPIHGILLLGFCFLHFSSRNR